MQQKDALNVLLTGRSEHAFSDLVKRIVTSKKLDFDIICLKPEVGPKNQHFPTTMLFKQAFLEDLMNTYKDADEIRVYEDRPKHVKGFRDFFANFRRSPMTANPHASNQAITAEVIQVSEGVKTLDPVTETAEVQRMVNDHNLSLSRLRSPAAPHQLSLLKIKRTIFYTGYLISPTDSTKLLQLVSLPSTLPDGEVKILANNILITPRPCPRSILDKVGGIGRKLSWQVTGTGVFENKIWAATVRPIPETAKHYTENPIPMVVLALRKTARPIDANRIQNWQPIPPDRAISFDSVVGEKVLLRVEEEHPGEKEWDTLFASKNQRRKHPIEHDPEQQPQQQQQPPPQLRHNQPLQSRGEHNSRNGGNPVGGGGGPNNYHQGPPPPISSNAHSSTSGPSYLARGGNHHSTPNNNPRAGRPSHRGNRGGRGRGGRGGGGGGGGSGPGAPGSNEAPGRSSGYGGGSSHRYRSLDDLPIDRDFSGGAAAGGGGGGDGPYYYGGGGPGGGNNNNNNNNNNTGPGGGGGGGGGYVQYQ
ncbi:MAG: hypothetical protein M1837_004896 [Sclerophora amabilis]|nr:MAG: hypothetical protein M1837_004896 [Sclerophora amabilis]